MYTFRHSLLLFLPVPWVVRRTVAFADLGFSSAYAIMASDYAWGFATSREIKSWSPERAPDSNCEDQPDDDWDVASLPQLSFKPLPFVDVSTQVKWNDLADLNSQEADKLKITNTEQSVHEPFLYDMRHRLSTVSVRSERGSKGYAQLWLNQPGNANLFGVRLIGDARTPHLFSSMAPADLALYSEWGMRRVQQYNGTEPLELVLPVRTHPAILKEAVLGIHSGVMTLSWHTAEAVLVMANSIGVSAGVANHDRLLLQSTISNMLCPCSLACWRLLVRITFVAMAHKSLFLCFQLPIWLIILA